MERERERMSEWKNNKIEKEKGEKDKDKCHHFTQKRQYVEDLTSKN